MSALVRLGLPSHLASGAARKVREEGGWNQPNAVLTIAPTEDKSLSGTDEHYYDIYVLSGEALDPKDWLCGYYWRPEGYVIVEIFRIVERVTAFLTAEEGAKEAKQTEGAADGEAADDHEEAAD